VLPRFGAPGVRPVQRRQGHHPHPLHGGFVFKLAPTPVTGITDPAQVTVPDTSVTVLIVTAGHIHHRLHSGLVDTLLFDQQHGWNNYAGELVNTSGANICKSRNEIIRRFLTQTDSEWAWLI